MGPIGPGAQCKGSGNPCLGSGTILDWLRGPWAVASAAREEACRTRLAFFAGECCDPVRRGRSDLEEALILEHSFIFLSGLSPMDLQVSLQHCNVCCGPCGKILGDRTLRQASSNTCGIALHGHHVLPCT